MVKKDLVMHSYKRIVGQKLMMTAELNVCNAVKFFCSIFLPSVVLVIFGLLTRRHSV